MAQTQDIKIFADIDGACEGQLAAIAASPAFEGSKIRVMPDAHSGVNSVVGFTATVSDKVIPNIVSGDIGCGVLAVQLKKPKKGLDFAKLDKVVRAQVPFGVGNVHADPVAGFDYETLRCWDRLPNKHVIPNSLGTLGAGNHFIEVDRDSGGSFWLVIHSGSRNLGTKVAEHYQALAGSRIGAEIPEDVSYATAWLEGGDMEDYLHDMSVAVEFAARNRSEMARLIMKGYGLKEQGRVESVHNYIDVEDMIIRKGAISAKAGQECIIPLNMAEGCAIARGLGNGDWNCSAPHGTGRSMTRKDARESIAMSDYKQAMRGIWSSCVSPNTVDESPAAYKDSGSVLARLPETAEILEIMESVYNFKAPDAK